jgi:ABC-type antimicrobial peptide transport system permease subunit
MQEEILFEEANGYNNNLTQIFFFLTTLGSLLSAFGIYAMAKLNVQLRFREIGIRKTLGSGVSNIIKLLNREFALILTIAAIAGGFIGYFMTNALLDDLYTYHLEISIFTLLVSGVSIFIIGIISTSSTIFRAANTNPIEILKDE